MTEQELTEIERRLDQDISGYGYLPVTEAEVRALIAEVRSLRLALLGKSEEIKFVSGGGITFMPDDGTEH